MKRLALVISNAAYEHTPALNNPPNVATIGYEADPAGDHDPEVQTSQFGKHSAKAFGALYGRPCVPAPSTSCL
jgi:hypothetical protein